MEERYQCEASAQPPMANRRARDVVECSPMKDEMSDMRKHELIMFAEEVVAKVRAANIRGRERCFVNNVVNLLLDS